MTAPAQHLLESFSLLSEADKHLVVTEIMRQYTGAPTGDVPDEALVEVADELFRALDAEEARNASR